MKARGALRLASKKIKPVNVGTPAMLVGSIEQTPQALKKDDVCFRPLILCTNGQRADCLRCSEGHIQVDSGSSMVPC